MSLPPESPQPPRAGAMQQVQDLLHQAQQAVIAIGDFALSQAVERITQAFRSHTALEATLAELERDATAAHETRKKRKRARDVALLLDQLIAFRPQQQRENDAPARAQE